MDSKNTVFVVDNDPSMLKAIKRLLTQQGFQAVLFSSANELRHHDHFEQAICIVIDVDLGAESGITLHQELRARGATPPVIYMSGKETSRTAALASGCFAYLTKPFSAASLIEPLQTILRYRD